MYVDEVEGSWSHVINLSGDDFLIKPIEHIEKELSQKKGISYIGYEVPSTFESDRSNVLIKSNALLINSTLG
jgi:hypothetical protein